MIGFPKSQIFSRVLDSGINAGSKKKKRKKLQMALLIISSSVVHGFLQDLDIGNVVLAQ